jgi:prolyl oligopeptidase
MFFSCSSFLNPGIIYSVDFSIDTTAKIFRQTKIATDCSDLETHQVFYKSHDGKEIPMFITKQKGEKSKRRLD